VRLLTNLATERDTLLQIVLAGQPELRQKLAAPSLEPLRQRIAVHHHVEPLQPDEVLAYLRYRIQVAGGRYEQVFEPGCDAIFARFTAGRPRAINILADRVLLAAFGKQIRPVPACLVQDKAREMVAALAVPSPKPDEDNDPNG
jgi:general secretion pathway protein A